MTAIFVSYSSTNRDFALQLADKLDQFFDVWIDREGLEGGMAWEKAIQDALDSCTVFVVIVTPESNQSEWVARETILAEQLKKYRIPILLVGELPFRLLNLHYIDFRGEFEGGFRDLLDALKKHLQPQDKTRTAVNQLLGEAIRARLTGDIATANNTIGQALAIQPDLGQTVEAFWNQLHHTPKSADADQLQALLDAGKSIIKEDTHLLDDKRYGDRETYEWSIFVDAPESILDQIDSVQYTLHPTFADRLRTVRNRESQFKLTMIGWGIFNVPVEIRFKDGSVVETDYDLQFESLD